MFGFIISLVVIFREVFVTTSAQSCPLSWDMEDFYCKDLVVIKYPFWYYDDYSNDSDYRCGYPGFGIKCVDDRTTTVINISNHLYRVSNLNYDVQSVRVKDMDIVDGEECPHQRQNLSWREFDSSLKNTPMHYWTLFYNCSSPPNNKTLEEFHVACLDNSGRRSYAFPNESDIPNGFNWYGNCEETLVAHKSFTTNNYTVDAKIALDLHWSVPRDDCMKCENSSGKCSYYRKGGFRNCVCRSGFSKEFRKTCPLQNIGISLEKQHTHKSLSTEVKVLIGVFTGVGVLVLLVLLIYKRILLSLCTLFNSHWRKTTKGPTNVEMFLESCRHLTVQRYKYSDIKKMTNSFKETLGQGGYGSVFKGKLKHDDRLVAIKLLNESKGNGEDFINEVATIGRTNHVNVVSLLGFCSEGTKRALVYEFMPNGSLERFIYNEKKSSTPLGWEKLYEIALGIARGLEYLHRGCNTRILHFDIKPHNILLDQEFIPKISDFGLAKLCPTRESVVSMLVARGTIGYIAPEVICRNFGGVSHKSDVYSYGMMVFEIIGGRKNIDATLENISEIYFPQWIYNRLITQEINVEGSREIFEDETTKKMIIVALWCIQTQPADRPSISKVVEMLEENTEDLQMPPNPFQDPPSRSSP